MPTALASCPAIRASLGGYARAWRTLMVVGLTVGILGCATGKATGVACRDYPVQHSGFSLWPWMWPVDLVFMAGESAYRKAAAYRECAQEVGQTPTTEAGD